VTRGARERAQHRGARAGVPHERVEGDFRAHADPGEKARPDALPHPIAPQEVGVTVDLGGRKVGVRHDRDERAHRLARGRRAPVRGVRQVHDRAPELAVVVERRHRRAAAVEEALHAVARGEQRR
jgi:hypothetical protein